MSELDPIPFPPRPHGSLAAVKKVRQDTITLWHNQWLSDFLGDMIQGGSYLLGGAPGSRKSGLAMQIALDLARRDECVLFIPTEEPPTRLLDRAGPMMSGWSAKDIIAGYANCCVVRENPSIDQLPGYLTRQVISPDGLFHNRNIKLVILDSVQGQGLPATATRRYERLFEAIRLLSAARITTLLINHVTKRNELAGPRTLEHAVDAVLLLRKTPAARLLFCLKNRFGPADLREPMVLGLDPITLRLNPSPLGKAMVAASHTYLGVGTGATQIQAGVSLATLGSRGRVMAPGLPKEEIQQLVGSIAQLPGIDLDDVDFTINCRFPSTRAYRGSVGLAMAMALLGSYLQKPVPANYLYIGEVDLGRNVCPLDDQFVNQLVNDIGVGTYFSGGWRIFVHPSAAVSLPRGDGIEVVPCERLEQALYATWPELR